MGTHLLIIKNPKALERLYEEETCCQLIARASEKGRSLELGDTMVARDELLNSGFKWGKDFYIKKCM